MFYTANQTIFSLDIQGVENSEGSKLQVLAFDGIEAVNSEYIFEVTLVSKHLRYDITKLLSKSAYLSFYYLRAASLGSTKSFMFIMNMFREEPKAYNFGYLPNPE